MFTELSLSLFFISTYSPGKVRTTSYKYFPGNTIVPSVSIIAFILQIMLIS